MDGPFRSAYLRTEGAPIPRALTAIEVDLPDSLSAKDTSIALLEERLAAAGGRAFVGIKEHSRARTAATAGWRPHPLWPDRSVRRGLRGAVSPTAIDDALANLERAGVRILRYYENLGYAHTVVPAGGVATLLTDPSVDWVSPDDATYRLDALPPTPAPRAAGLPAQETPWGITSIRAPLAWSFTQGSGTKLLVLDQGYDRGHEDLPVIPQGNCRGVNVGCDPEHMESHGTHVFGIAAALNNALGVVGVAPGVPENDITVWGACNGSSECPGPELSEAINWAVPNLVPKGVINMSWSNESYTPEFAQAVASAASAGIVMLASAGNDGLNQVMYPAGFSDVIGVSGMRDDSTFATTAHPCVVGSGSNWGSHVDFTAPWYATSTTFNNGYQGAEYPHNWCGASMATAHVTGVALMIRARFPNYGPSSVVYQMAKTAKSLGNPPYFGAGLPRADLAAGFGPAEIAAVSIQSGKPKLTWSAVPLATEYRIYRRVTPYAPEWELWAVRTTASYTDISTAVSSIWSLNSCFAMPSQTAVAYQVRSYNATHGVEHSPTTCPVFIANGIPPY